MPPRGPIPGQPPDNSDGTNPGTRAESRCKPQEVARRALECNMTGRYPIFKNLHNSFRKKLHFNTLFRNFILQNNRKIIWKQQPIVLQQIIITRSGIFGQFLYPFQEFRMKNDSLKSMSRIASYGSAPPPPPPPGRMLALGID